MDKQKIKRYLSNPLRIFLKPWISLAPYIKNDELFLRGRYLFQMGKALHLNPPRTFNEKLQWLKLHNRKPEYTQMVDKYSVKDYIKKTIGSEYVVPLLAYWDDVDKVDISNLPDKFVLKLTNGGGGSSVVICKGKKDFSLDEAKKHLRRSVDFYSRGREWPYKDVKNRIIAEKYLENEGGLVDYKIHCFNGVPKLILVCQNRFSSFGLTEDFYDENWNHLNIKRPNHNNSPLNIDRPKCLNKMLDLARILANNIPFVRIDFYIVNDQIYFGEITFYPATGMHKFIPETWDSIMGKWLILNN